MSENGTTTSDRSTTFKDLKDRSWTISITVYAAKVVKEKTGVNVFNLVDNRYKGLTDLQSDLSKLVDVIFVLCEEQAKERKISDEDFGRALAGDCLGAANEAFENAIIDFFPDRAMRDTHRKVKEKAARATKLLIAEAEQELENLSDTSLVERLKKMYGSGQELAELSPGDSPGGNSP